MRVIVSGGRDFDNVEFVCSNLSRLYGELKFDTLIHGGARGVDTIAEQWARSNNVKTEVFYADWEKYGRSAGMIRNRKMINSEIDLLIAFPGGRGTENAVHEASKKGIRIITISLQDQIRR